MLHRLDIAIHREQALSVAELHRPNRESRRNDRKPNRGRHGSDRMELADLICSGTDDASRRLRHFVPGAGHVTEGFGNDQPSLVTDHGRISTSGWSWRSVVTSVEKKSDRLSPSLEYRNAQIDSPSLVATVPWKGYSTP